MPSASPASTTSAHRRAETSDRRIPAMNSNPAITASRRPRAAATWSDSTPRPRQRRRWHVASTAARSAALNGRAWPATAVAGGPAVAGEQSGGRRAGPVCLTGEAGPEARRGNRHRGDRGGAPRVVELVEAQQQGRLQRKLDKLARYDVVILD